MNVLDPETGRRPSAPSSAVGASHKSPFMVASIFRRLGSGIAAQHNTAVAIDKLMDGPCGRGWGARALVARHAETRGLMRLGRLTPRSLRVVATATRHLLPRSSRQPGRSSRTLRAARQLHFSARRLNETSDMRRRAITGLYTSKFVSS